MKLLFVITGFGYGDSIRAEAVINELKKYKARVMILGYDHSYDYFKDKFLTLKIIGYRFPDYGFKFRSSRFLMKNYLLPVTWLYTVRKYKKVIERFDPDLIISDFEPLGNILAKKLGKKCISVFGFNPKLYKKFKGKTRNLNLQAKYIERLYKNSDKVIIPAFKENKDYDNLAYVNLIVREYNNDKNKVMKKLRLDREPVIVMLGGSNFGLKLGKEIIKLRDSLNEEIIVFGGKKQIPGYHHINYIENFLDYLLVSKAVVSLAGFLTISECLSFKKPILIYPIKNHVEQLLNAYSLKNLVPVRYNLNNVEKDLKYLLDKKDKIINNIKKLKIKDNGAEQAAKIIKEEV